MPDKPKEIYLILDNIRSSHNVGAIFRTADAAGVKKVYLCGITPIPPSKELAKTALAALENSNWEYWEQTTDLVKQLKQNGIPIICLEQHQSSHDYRTFNYPKRFALVVGNEIEGVGPEVLQLAEAILEIPMRGTAKSLNVATATGIVLYQAL